MMWAYETCQGCDEQIVYGAAHTCPELTPCQCPTDTEIDAAITAAHHANTGGTK